MSVRPIFRVTHIGSPIALRSVRTRLCSPPFLFVDLSNVHERVFKEFIAAYKQQVKRANFSDRERIDTSRLSMLSVVPIAANRLGPIRGCVVNTLRLILGSDQE